MVVGVGHIVFRIHQCRSLNASGAEVADNDIYQRAVIGISLVGSDRRMINAKLDKVFNFADGLGLAEMIDSQLEIISL